MPNIYGISRYGEKTVVPVFQLPTHGYIYRPLKHGDQGWDVYALQTALKFLGHDVIHAYHGIFDLDLQKAVRVFQKRKKLKVDGIAGVVTQRAIAVKICPIFTNQYVIPKNQLKGQLEKESAFWLGNHSPAYDNGTNWDIGICQRSTRYHSFEAGFNVPISIDYLTKHIRETYDKYTKPDAQRIPRLQERGLPVPTNRDRWRLAAGSWNRPAHTAWLAGQPNSESAKPNQEQLEWIRGYMDRVCVYSDIYYKDRSYPT